MITSKNDRMLELLWFVGYCGEFPSIVVKDNIVGTQFHPEKSQKAGFKVIKNFLRM